METETLSNYEQTQSRHILDDSMDGNIPREDDEVDSLLTKDVSEENLEVKHKESFSDSTESLKESINCRDSENKENENEDCDVSFTNNESNDYEESEGENQTAESEEENKHEEENKSEKENDASEIMASANRSTTSSPVEEDILEKEKDVVNENEENSSPNIEEKDPLAEDDEDENMVEKEKDLHEEKKTEENETQNTVEDEVQIEKDNNQKENEDNVENTDSSENIEKNEENTVEDEVQKQKEKDDNQKENEDTEEKTDSGENIEKNAESTLGSKDITEKLINENSKESNDNMENTFENRDISKDYPLLKETLTKSKSTVEQQKEGDAENALEDVDMDEDLDPSLLCPDIAMEVDEAPVITTNDNASGNDGSKSPLLYEASFSTYVDEMTGAEVSFNLTSEEQQMRQELFGEDNPVQYTRIHCTACNVHLGSALDGQSNRFVHPLLKVLICKGCYHFYTSGEFEKDEDGSELYCRWCGQGGQVMCCSQCEMVFCKKCIRINFGRKKLIEIRDSEEWLCFRCDPSQLTALRVHCAEFMEYVRREISRAATLENATSFTTTDYTQCCVSQKKKVSEPSTSEPKKKKRKSSVNPDYDPDYDPTKASPSPQPSTSATSPEPFTTKTSQPATVLVKKQVPILPKPVDPNHNAGIVTVTPRSSDSIFRVGNTTFKPRSSVYTPRPRVQVVTSTSVGPRATSSSAGYIKLMPNVLPGTSTGSRGLSAQTYVSPSTTRPQAPFQNRAVRATAPTMKHEWFEKTVRAAARVNSNLSYTLTQLNRAQASATTVEALAVVHNKLQEILSTSINSLIQIRKNLRQEFIAGIKNIRFQSKPPQMQPQKFSSTQDDDVIFVSPSPSPGPPPLIATTSGGLNSFSSINLPPSVSLNPIKKNPVAAALLKSDSFPISTANNTVPKPVGGFLRVKSLTALQSVPAECITIPDDPVPPPPLTPIKRNSPEITIVNDSPDKEEAVKTTVIVDLVKLQSKNKEKVDNNIITNGDSKDTSDNVKSVLPEQAADPVVKKGESASGVVTYNLKDTPSTELKKIMDIKVYLKRSEEIDRLVKNTFGLVNGDVSE